MSFRIKSAFDAGIVSLLMRLYFVHPTRRPREKGCERLVQRASKRRQRIFDPKYATIYDSARDHTVAFKLAQRVGQNPLRHAFKPSFDDIETLRLVQQNGKDHHRPLVSDLIKDDPAWAIGTEDKISFRKGSIVRHTKDAACS